MNKNILKFILAVVILVLAGIVVYAFNQAKISKTAMEVSLETSVPSPRTAGRNWKTYTNERMGFEIKYPLTYAVKEEKSRVVFESAHAPETQADNSIEFVKIRSSLKNAVANYFSWATPVIKWENPGNDDWQTQAVVIGNFTGDVYSRDAIYLFLKDYPRDLGDDGSRVMDIVQAHLVGAIGEQELAKNIDVLGVVNSDEIKTADDRMLATFKFIE